jgi:very-short-patch-repair endonuclease
MRLLLERAGVTGLVPNHPVRDERGRLVGIVDLADVDARLAVEYQGDHHRTDRDTYRSDLQRREDFEDVGWRQVQASDDDLGPGSTAFVARVKRLVCERRGTEMSRLAEKPCR